MICSPSVSTPNLGPPPLQRTHRHPHNNRVLAKTSHRTPGSWGGGQSRGLSLPGGGGAMDTPRKVFEYPFASGSFLLLLLGFFPPPHGESVQLEKGRLDCPSRQDGEAQPHRAGPQAEMRTVPGAPHTGPGCARPGWQELTKPHVSRRPPLPPASAPDTGRVLAVAPLGAPLPRRKHGGRGVINSRRRGASIRG